MNPILVTGLQRTGTTWVGRVLASAGLAYISEPFNLHTRAGVCAIPKSAWYQYVTTDNEHLFQKPFAETLKFRYDWKAESKTLTSLKDVARMARDWNRFRSSRGKRPLIKDPIAFFSAEWISERFNADVIVMIRHPAAFASSQKRLGWHFDFDDLLRQQHLMRDMLDPFSEDMRAASQADIVSQAATLWKIVYSIALQYRERHKDWLFVRHEDACNAPLETFQYVFARLGIEASPESDRFIAESTSSSNNVETDRTHELNRSSRSLAYAWHQRLTQEEIESVRSITNDVASHFYTDEDWTPQVVPSVIRPSASS